MNPKILQPASRHFLAWLILSTIFFCLAVVIAAQTYVLHESRERIQAQIAEVENRLAKRPVIKVSKTQLDEKKQWQQLEKEFQYPWKHLFAAIEKATDKQIELLELMPDKASRLVILRGEATNIASLVAFVERLEDNPNLAMVYLSHQEKVTRERLETLGFEVKITLR